MPRARVASVAGFIAALAASLSSHQVRDLTAPGAAEPRIGRGVISGTIVDADTGRPMRRATANINADVPLSVYSILTDDEGRFIFDQLPVSRFTLTASKPGFVPSAYGGSSWLQEPARFPLTDGQRLGSIVLALTRGATISGVVNGPTNAPASGVNVTALKRMPGSNSGSREPVTLATVQTDVEGRYRLTELPAGEYLVRASTTEDRPIAAEGGSGLRAIAGTFHPSALAILDAATVVVAAGDDRPDVDVQMRLVSTFALTGRVILPSEGAFDRGRLLINASAIERGSYARPPSTRYAVLGSDGSFVIRGLPSGDFFLTGMLPIDNRSVRRLQTTQRITIDGQDVSGMELELQMPSIVSGRIEFRGAATPPDPSGMQIVLPWADGPDAGPPSGEPRTQVEKDGAFHCDAPPGRYRMAQSWGLSYRGWWVQSAMLNGRDLLDDVIEVKAGEDIGGVVFTLTDHPSSELGGVVLDAEGKPGGAYTLTVFPVDRRLRTPGSRRIASARAALDGTFSVQGLPLGDYFVAPALDVERSQEFDPDFLQELESRGPMKITLRYGEQRKIELRVGRQ